MGKLKKMIDSNRRKLTLSKWQKTSFFIKNQYLCYFCHSCFLRVLFYIGTCWLCLLFSCVWYHFLCNGRKLLYKVVNYKSVNSISLQVQLNIIMITNTKSKVTDITDMYATSNWCHQIAAINQHNGKQHIYNDT